MSAPENGNKHGEEPARLAFVEALSEQDRLILEAAPCQSFVATQRIERGRIGNESVLILVTGAVGLRHDFRDGRTSISTIYVAGDTLDFRYIDTEGCTLTCLSDTEVRVMNGTAFDEWLAASPGIRALFTSNYHKLCRLVASHCADLARKSALEKVASFIFECRNRQVAGEDEALPLTLKRIDIADYMGLRPETLSRTFAKLKHLGLIEFDAQDHIRIRDEPMLRKIADGIANEASLNSNAA